MKFTSLLTLALCAGLPALAQSPAPVPEGDSKLSFYGILDAGVATIQHSLNFDPNFPAGADPRAGKVADKSATGMMNGGISGTRIGVRGAADLGNGWKAIMNLEAGISVTTGTLSNAVASLATNKNAAGTPTLDSGNMSGDSAVSGQLFGRQAFVGISSDTYGTLTFGRHTSFMLDNIGGYDPVQGAQFFSPLGYSGSYGGGGMTDDSRIDNSVKYKVKVGGFNIGLLTKFSGVAGSSSAQSAFQANVGYEAGPLGIQGSIQSNKDAFSLANPNGTTQPMGTVVATPQDTSSYLVVARYKISAFTIKAGYEYMKFSNPSNPYEDAGVTSLYGTTVSIATTTPYTLTSGPASGQEIDKTLKVYWVGADWNITPQFNIALGYYHVDQNDYSGNPAVASSKSAGTGKYTSLLLDYHFTKKFDAYAGYMSNTNADGMAFGYLHDSNSITGLGLRYSF